MIYKRKDIVKLPLMQEIQVEHCNGIHCVYQCMRIIRARIIVSMNLLRELIIAYAEMYY